MAANDLAQLLAPQFEAWLSFQSVTSEGLVSRRNDVRRNHVITVHGAPARLEEALLDEWADCTPEQAHTTLSKPDVVVTNMKDKETQLGKLRRFNDEVKSSFSLEELEELSGNRAIMSDSQQLATVPTLLRELSNDGKSKDGLSRQPSLRPLQVGDMVRVKREVKEPKYKWGSGVSHETVGTIKKIDSDGDCKVDFGGRQRRWNGVLDEMELVAAGPGSSTKAAEAERQVWVQQKAAGLVGPVFPQDEQHPQLAVGQRVLDIGDSGALGVVLGWKADGKRHGDTTGGLSSNGCVRVFFYSRPDQYERNPWNIMGTRGRAPLPTCS